MHVHTKLYLRSKLHNSIETWSEVSNPLHARIVVVLTWEDLKVLVIKDATDRAQRAKPALN